LYVLVDEAFYAARSTEMVDVAELRNSTAAQTSTATNVFTADVMQQTI
jgi:hypothetical protein